MLKGKINIFLFILFLILCIGLLFIFSNNENITEGLVNESLGSPPTVVPTTRPPNLSPIMIFDITTTPQVTKVLGDPYPNYYEPAYDQLLSSYGDLANKVKEQNRIIDKQIDEYKKIHSIDYQKSVYENESTQKISVVYKYLFYIYYILLLVLFVYALVKGLISFKNPVHIILLALSIGFPYIIFTIEKAIYMFFNYIWSLFTDNVYSDIYLSTEY